LLGLRLSLPLQSRPAQISDGPLDSTEELTLGTVLIGLPLAAAGYLVSCAALMRYRETIRGELTQKRKKLALRRERPPKRSSRLKEKIVKKVPSRRKRNRLTGKP
jgi:hypothetical protein